MATHKLGIREREAIYSVLDDAEREVLGGHVPHPSIEVLDEHCSELFPGWKKSLVFSKPRKVREDVVEVTEEAPVQIVSFAYENDSPCTGGGRHALASNVVALQDDIVKLMTKIGESLPKARVEERERDRGIREAREREEAHKEAERRGVEGTSATTIGITKRKQFPGKAKMRQMEIELAALRKETALLKKQMSKAKQELGESQQRVERLKFRLQRSEQIRQRAGI